MSGFMDSNIIEIACPKCRTKHPKSIGWLKANNHLVCRCGTHINFDKSNFMGGVQKIGKALADLQRTFRKLGG